MIEREATSIVKPGTAEDERKIRMLARPEKEIEQPDFPGVLEPKQTKTPRRRRYSWVLVLLIASVVGAGAWRLLYPRGNAEKRTTQDVQSVGAAKIGVGQIDEPLVCLAPAKKLAPTTDLS